MSSLSHYTRGVERMLAQLTTRYGCSADSPYADALVFQSRLEENVRQAGLLGDTETRRADRAQIAGQLNELALRTLGVSFNDLCREEAPAPAAGAHGVPGGGSITIIGDGNVVGDASVASVVKGAGSGSTGRGPATEDRAGLEGALRMAKRTLAVLEQQAAGYTALTIPAHLQIELEEQRAKVAELEARLGTGSG